MSRQAIAKVRLGDKNAFILEFASEERLESEMEKKQ